MKKNRRAHGMAGYASGFSFIPQGNASGFSFIPQGNEKKNQLSIFTI